MKYKILSCITYSISKLFPKKNNRWIFGAWFGRDVSDNTLQVLEYTIEHFPNIEKIWIASEPNKYNITGCKFVKRNSLLSLKYILSAKVAIMNQGYSDFNALNLLGGCYKVQLWHGVAWKKIVKDSFKKQSRLDALIFDYINTYDLFIAPSLKYQKVLQSSFGADEKKIIKCGQPRNEKLFSEEYCIDKRNEFLKRLNSSAEKIIVYLPTFRDRNNEYFTFTAINNSLFCDFLKKNNAIIIEKQHFKVYEKLNTKECKENESVFLMPNESARDLLAIADILITDYSSCFFDYLIRNKPIIHFAYDYQYYKNLDRGLYYDVNEVAAGDVVYSVNELIESLQKNIDNPGINEYRRKTIKDSFITFETDASSEIIVNHVLKHVYEDY